MGRLAAVAALALLAALSLLHCALLLLRFFATLLVLLWRARKLKQAEHAQMRSRPFDRGVAQREARRRLPYRRARWERRAR